MFLTSPDLTIRWLYCTVLYNTGSSLSAYQCSYFSFTSPLSFIGSVTFLLLVGQMVGLSIIIWLGLEDTLPCSYQTTCSTFTLQCQLWCQNVFLLGTFRLTILKPKYFALLLSATFKVLLLVDKVEYDQNSEVWSKLFCLYYFSDWSYFLYICSFLLMERFEVFVVIPWIICSVCQKEVKRPSNAAMWIKMNR